MAEFTIDELTTWSGGRWSAGPDRPMRGFHYDSRSLSPGQVFVALRSERRDGHDFVEAARAAGAPAAIVARQVAPMDFPQLVVRDPLTALQTVAGRHRGRFAGPVAAVTGSCGKTSTKDLLGKLLGSSDTVCSTEANLNNLLGVPISLTRLDPGVHRFGVFEAGIDRPGEMSRLGEMIRPDLAIVTLVAPAHLAGLGSLDGVAREKAVLFDALRPGGTSVFTEGCLDYDAFRDEGRSGWVVRRKSSERSLPAGCRPVDFWTMAGREGWDIEIQLPHSGAFAARVPPMSPGMVGNAVLACVGADLLGAEASGFADALESWEPGRWRGETRSDNDRFLYIDCYNANPASMSDALEHFEAIAPADMPRLYVLGGMEELGDSAADWHRQVGRRIQLRPEDRVVGIGEHAADLLAGAAEAGAEPAQLEENPERKSLRDRIAAHHGAVMLKASRGHRLEELIETTNPESTARPAC